MGEPSKGDVTPKRPWTNIGGLRERLIRVVSKRDACERKRAHPTSPPGDLGGAAG